MKIDLGQTIGILANVGVIAGIVFLGYEIRQNTVALQSETAQGVHNQIATIYGLMLEDSLQEILLQDDDASLTALQQGKLDTYRSLIFRAWENMYVQIQAGAWDEGLAEGWWLNLRESFETPSFAQHWQENRRYYSPAFRNFVESEVMHRQLMAEP
jgi:hypothetical protein